MEQIVPKTVLFVWPLVYHKPWGKGCFSYRNLMYLLKEMQPFAQKSVIKQEKMDLEQEKHLVELAKNDIEAFGELYDRYYSQIIGYVLKRTASIEVAQDITSEVFFKALNNLHKFHWRGIPFSAWLYRIAGNEVANHFRRNGQQQLELDKISKYLDFSEPSSESELLAAEAELKKAEDFLVLHEIIAQLPARYQEVIVLRFFENKRVHEISQILGKREGTVKSLLHRGLEKMRKAMK
jgi:RNA polymerase sigma-70 factor (ECF subfamily)